MAHNDENADDKERTRPPRNAENAASAPQVDAARLERFLRANAAARDRMRAATEECKQRRGALADRVHDESGGAVTLGQLLREHRRDARL